MRFGFRKLLPRIGTAAVLVAVLVLSRSASAEYFQFGTTINIGAVAPVPTSVAGDGTANVVVTSAVGTPIVFTGLETNTTENLVGIDGGTDIVFGIIDFQVVNATPLQNISIPFTFNVTITDYPTDTVTVPEGSGVFQVTGLISGTIGAGRKVNMNNISFNPVAPILIGNDLYSMTLNQILPPGPVFPGAIGAHVEIVPEPSALALIGLGLVSLATPAVRRRMRLRRNGSQ